MHVKCLFLQAQHLSTPPAALAPPLSLVKYSGWYNKCPDRFLFLPSNASSPVQLAILTLAEVHRPKEREERPYQSSRRSVQQYKYHRRTAPVPCTSFCCTVLYASFSSDTSPIPGAVSFNRHLVSQVGLRSPIRTWWWSRFFRADRYVPDLHHLPHVAGWGSYDLHDPYSTCFLGWICTMQTLHIISWWQVTM